MPTLEERVTQLENDLKQFKAETVKAYQDLSVPFAMVRGLTETNVGQLAVVRATQDEHTRRLESIDSRLNAVEGRLEAQDKKLDQILLRLDALAPKQEP